MSQSKLKVKQQDAATLAAGYSKTFRFVEIASIVIFWALSLALAVKVSPHFLAHPVLIIAAVFFGYVAADFVSGLVHWLGDTWGSTEMPILGAALIRPFREHHVDEKAITRHDYIETNGANCMISVPVAALSLFVPIDPASNGYLLQLFGVTGMGAMIFWVMMTNQFHKWSHMDTPPSWVARLQKWHVILPVDHHQIHHTAPFEKYYCITCGWLNWPLNKIGFYRHAERLITAVTGALPRRDDIGIEAALAIDPTERTQPATSKPHAL